MAVAAQPAAPLTRDEALKLVEGGATLVTGNDRLARLLRLAYHGQRRAAGETAWASPHVHSWAVWMDRLWRDLVYRSAQALPQRLNADQERALWERVIRRRESDEKPLLSVEATAETARAAWRLTVEWRLEREGLAGSESEDVRAFALWSADFERACAEEGFLDSARAVDLLIERSAAFKNEAPVLLAGFDVYTPQQTALLDAFRRAGVAVRMVGPRPECERVARKVACETRRDEVRAAARWAKRLADAEPEARIAVVVPGLGARRQEVERIFREAFDAEALLLGAAPRGEAFTIAAGLPLACYPLVHSALTALEMNPGGMPFSTFAAWLRGRGLPGGRSERSARGLLDRKLRDKGVSSVTIGGLSSWLKETPRLRKVMQRWARRFRNLPSEQGPAEWTDSFSALLSALGWPGKRKLASEDLAVVEKWNDLLGAFAALGATVETMRLDEARRTLARMAAETLFQPATGPSRVEVMDLLESAGAEADHLWATGMDDESWPAPARPNPFLPMKLQRERGLPHASAEVELAFARVETERLLASAPDVVLSYATAEEDRTLSASALIAALPGGKLTELAPEEEPSLIARLYAGAKIEPLLEDAAPPVEPGQQAPGGTSIFKFQAHCPFQAFAALRLGAKGLRTADPGLGPIERGNLVHYAMETIWKELGGSRELAGQSEEARVELIRRGVDDAVARLAKERRETLPPRFEQVERARLEELLAAWLATELEHRRNPFRVVQTEEERKTTLFGIPVKLRIDRVDELDDGRQIIVDYKTGKTTSTEWDHERSLEPQLPLYAISHEAELGGALFAKPLALEAGFKGAVGVGVEIRGADGNQENFEGRVERWRRNLGAIAQEYLDGQAAVDPRDNRCDYCELPALCRKDDRA